MARSRIIAGKAVIIIEAQDLVNKTLGKVRSNLHRFSNEVGKIGEGLFRTGFFGAIGSGVLINSFVKFDDALRNLRINLDFLGVSTKEADTIFGSLEKRIRELAQSTPFNPIEVAETATLLAKGGFDPKEIEESLEGVLDLARATSATLPQSVEIVVRSMRTFGIATDKSNQVVSQFVRAARKGTLDIEDLAAALTYSQGTADTLGVSLQKMLAIFTVLSNRGLVGSIAGTSTNTAFSQLVKKAQELKDIGKIELVTGIREDGREAIDVIKSLENVFKFADTLDFTEQQTLFQDVFNLRGARSVAGLRRELANIEKLTNFIANANDEARKSSKFRDAGPGGALRRLTSTLQELGIVLGETSEKPITAIANAIKGLATELGKLAQINPVLTSLIILSPGILLAAGAGMIVLAKGLRVAAVAAGLLRAGLAPLARFFAKGTVAQITAASIALQRARGPSKAPVITRKVTQTAAKAVEATSARQANRLLLAQNQRNAVLAVQRRAKAETLLAEAVKNKNDALNASKDRINQVTVAQVRNNAALKENASRIWDQQRAEKNRLRAVTITTAKTKQADLAQAAIDIAAGKRALARQQIDRLVADRQLVRQNILGSATTKFEVDSLRLREEGLTQEIALARKRASSIRPLEFQTPKVVVPATKATEQTNKLLAQRTALLNKQTKLDSVATSLTFEKIAITDRYNKQLVKGQDLLVSSAKAQQAVREISLPQRAAGFDKALSGLATSSGRGLVTFGRNALIGAKGLLSFLNTTRRFVFSVGGIITILEVLLLFGDKIPIVASGFNALGRGFSNAFKAIGNIAKFAVGPIALFRASIEAFNADRSDLGIKGLLGAFSSLASIIGNQLIAAWNRFKEAIAPVYDFIVGLFTVIDVTVRSIVDSVSAVIGAAIATQSQLSDSLTGFNFGEGGSGILSGIRAVAEGIAKFIPSLFNWIAEFAVTFNEQSQKFIVGLEAVFNRLDPRQDADTAETIRKTQIAEIESGANLARRKLELSLEGTLDKITKAFNTSSATTSAKNANQASNRSAQISNNAQTFAQQILTELRRVISKPVQQFAPFNQAITPQGNPLNNPSVRSIKLIADALVGSVQATRGNLLRAGTTIEEKQLEEQKTTNEILKAQARNQGVLFAP